MKEYDIGILTFWNVPNYGTYAQAYALQKVLQTINPKSDVRQINHLDKHHYHFYYDAKQYYKEFGICNKAFWKGMFMRPVHIEEKEISFLKAYSEIPHTDEITESNSNIFKFKKIFIGSDIVWDFSLEPFNHDKMLFGNELNGEINSYAASFGTVKLGDELPDYVVSGIKQMKNISVRDANSANIVESITGKKPEIVLDPVWLWDFKNDKNIVQPNEENYILVYGQDFTEDFINNLVSYSKESGLRTIVLDCNNDNYTWCDMLIKQEKLSPLEWIGFFRGASAVATSTFHGVTFGLLFNKRIAFCKTDFIIAKVGGLLKELGIYELFQNRNDVKTMLEYNWDYNAINKIIEIKRNNSMSFLKKACGK